MHGIQRSSQRRPGLNLGGESKAFVSEGNSGGESGAIGAVRYRTLAGLRIVVMRVDVIGFVGCAMLNDLAVSADMDVRVRENRCQRIERQCDPGEIEIPADYHEATGSHEHATSASYLRDRAMGSASVSRYRTPAGSFLSTANLPLRITGSKLYATFCFATISTIASGPAGMQNGQ
jgi:hypothetical protein